MDGEEQIAFSESYIRKVLWITVPQLNQMRQRTAMGKVIQNAITILALEMTV